MEAQMVVLRRCVITALIGIGVWLASPASANDGYWVTIGDAERFGKSNQVELVTEDLRILLDDGYMNVGVKYVFKNTGPAITVTMAFPESCTNGAVKMSYQDFRSLVDGKPTEVTHTVIKQTEYTDEYRAVWKKQVSFKRGQQRKVEVRYRMPMGWSNTSGSGGTYILTTGATWKGKIKRLDVTVDWSRSKYMSRPTLDSLPFVQTTATSATCRLTNFEPEDDIGLFRVDGFFSFTLNGKEVPASLCMDMPPVLLESGSLLFPIVELAKHSYQNWLGQLFGSWEKDDVIEWSHPALKRFGSSIALDGSETTLDGKGRRFKMRRAPVVRNERVFYEKVPVRYVCLRDFVEALGGKCKWNARLRRVEITL